MAPTTPIKGSDSSAVQQWNDADQAQKSHRASSSQIVSGSYSSDDPPIRQVLRDHDPEDGQVNDPSKPSLSSPSPDVSGPDYLSASDAFQVDYGGKISTFAFAVLMTMIGRYQREAFRQDAWSKAETAFTHMMKSAHDIRESGKPGVIAAWVNVGIMTAMGGLMAFSLRSPEVSAAPKEEPAPVDPAVKPDGTPVSAESDVDGLRTSTLDGEGEIEAGPDLHMEEKMEELEGDIDTVEDMIQKKGMAKDSPVVEKLEEAKAQLEEAKDSFAKIEKLKQEFQETLSKGVVSQINVQRWQALQQVFMAGNSLGQAYANMASTSLQASSKKEEAHAQMDNAAMQQALSWMQNVNSDLLQAIPQWLQDHASEEAQTMRSIYQA